MGHQLTIEGDEAFALATELAALTGVDLAPAVTEALRASVLKERQRRTWVNAMIAETDKFAELLGNPPPASDHGWLYDDETGLPI